MLAGPVARSIEERGGGSGPPNGRSSRTYVQIRPVVVLPLARIGTVVSSAWSLHDADYGVRMTTTTMAGLV
jgi:hypothetical protein